MPLRSAVADDYMHDLAVETIVAGRKERTGFKTFTLSGIKDCTPDLQDGDAQLP